MLNLIYADLYKLSKSTAIKVCIILSCISAIALTYISHSIATGAMSDTIRGSAAGLGDVMIVFLLGSLMAGFLVCSDFESKLIHDAVACGNGRIAVVISKTLVYILLVALLVLPYAIATIVGFCTGAEFTTPFVPSIFLDILANKTGLGLTPAVICKIIVVSLITMLVYAARLSICLPIAFKVRKPVVVMAIGFAFGFLSQLVIALTKDVPILGDILSNTPFAMGDNVVTMEAGAGMLFKVTGSSFVLLIIIAAITYRLFRKAEIK
jgi:ABC-2 type transport system permease protein